MTSHVTAIPPAASETAAAHFSARFQFEVDCWDVFDSSRNGTKDYVLLDVRNARAFAHGHLPGAIHIYHREISSSRLASFPADTLFVVYSSGPHCNSAEKSAVLLARLGRPVKLMLGGVTGWRDEGFELERLVQPVSLVAAF